MILYYSSIIDYWVVQKWYRLFAAFMTLIINNLKQGNQLP